MANPTYPVTGCGLPACRTCHPDLIPDAPPAESVLSLLVAGLHNREIATQLSISTRTVHRRCDDIYAKFGVGSRTEAVVRAISTKLLSVGDGQQ